MADIARNNTGFLWKNANKQQETHADYIGSMNYEGEQLWVNGWINTSKDGKKYLTLSVKLKEASRDTRATFKKHNVGNGAPDPDDEIPF